jgi:hypothetical protein
VCVFKIRGLYAHDGCSGGHAVDIVTWGGICDAYLVLQAVRFELLCSGMLTVVSSIVRMRACHVSAVWTLSWQMWSAELHKGTGCTTIVVRRSVAGFATVGTHDDRALCMRCLLT